ncbi:MFS transporter [Xenorhabdus thailandensis]|uniref:MFS transporter n=1 Tax=Xenorhabdus thailandensis TaxID=3136255 RepID=UPI0030F4347A
MRRRTIVTTLFICLSQMILIAGITTFSAMADKIALQLSVSYYSTALATSSYGLSFGSFLIISPFIITWIGTLKAVRLATLGWAVSGFLISFCNDITLITTFRYIQGFFSALLAPCLLLLLKYTLAERFDRFMPVWGSVSPLGALFGVILSGFVLSFYQWQYGGVFLSVIMLVTSYSLLKLISFNDKKRKTITFPLHGLSFVGAVTSLYSLLFLVKMQWIYTAFVAGIIFMLLLYHFLHIEKNNNQLRLIHPQAILSEKRSYYTAWMFCVSGLLACYFFIVPAFIRSTIPGSELNATLYFIPFSIALIGTSVLFSKISMSLQNSNNTSFVIVVSVIVFLGAIWFLSNATTSYLILLSMIVSAISISITFSCATSEYFGKMKNEALESAAIVSNAAFELGPSIILSIVIPIGGIIIGIVSPSREENSLFQLIGTGTLLIILMSILSVGIGLKRYLQPNSHNRNKSNDNGNN